MKLAVILAFALAFPVRQAIGQSATPIRQPLKATDNSAGQLYVKPKSKEVVTPEFAPYKSVTLDCKNSGHDAYGVNKAGENVTRHTKPNCAKGSEAKAPQKINETVSPPGASKGSRSLPKATPRPSAQEPEPGGSIGG